MEKKNQKLLIIVGVLLLVGGVSLAYFVSNVLTNGNGGNTKVTTAVIKGARIDVEGLLSFEDLDIYPGHKVVSSIKITATGNNELIPYNLIWQGTNSLTTPLELTVYKTSEEIDVSSSCNKKTKVIGGTQALFEECTISNIDKLGTEISSGRINKNDTKVTLVKDEFVTATSTGDVKYYYVILEYPNLDEPQNEDLTGEFDGEVTVEESNIKPDINILAAYVIQEDGTYKEVDDIPQSGYQLNTSKSTCSNGAIPTWDSKNKGLLTTNLTKSGTSCYLYFDNAIASKVLLTTNDLTNENGYRYQGIDPNNYVTFNNELWRIIGVFDTKKSDGTTEQLVKIIRNEPIGDIRWDTSSSYGSNDWSESDIKTILNGQYLNGNNINYTYRNPNNNNGYVSSNPTVTINNVSLNAIARDMIEEVVWHLGGAPSNSITTEAMYIAERGTTGGKDNLTLTEWSGKVGLMYVSDYGYASSALKCARTTTLSGYHTNTGCADKNWLNTKNYDWLITPLSSAGAYVFIKTSGGSISSNDWAIGNRDTRPSLYLKSSVKIMSGDGSETNPYQLE